jgi:hypothetical protein
MEPLVEAKPSPQTNTSKRDWADSETGSREAAIAEVVDRARHHRSVDLVQIRSGSNLYADVSGTKEDFAMSPSDDPECATRNMPGTDLPVRLEPVLPFLAEHVPFVGTALVEIVERLVGRYARFAHPQGAGPHEASPRLEADSWMDEVRAWASSFPQRDPVVDDTRESIYGDRL